MAPGWLAACPRSTCATVQRPMSGSDGFQVGEIPRHGAPGAARSCAGPLRGAFLLERQRPLARVGRTRAADARSPAAGRTPHPSRPVPATRVRMRLVAATASGPLAHYCSAASSTAAGERSARAAPGRFTRPGPLGLARQERSRRLAPTPSPSGKGTHPGIAATALRRRRGDEPAPDLGQPEAGIVGGDHEVARQHDLESARRPRFPRPPR